ncbi:MAG: phospho-sugar mutase [Ruminococcaceae bacterium]|nr:phospho-sugar mutase [Oscillospiraceae bacterium]
MEDYRKRYLEWLQSDKVDEETKAELRAIENNDEEIEFRFGSYMEFGTGGLRSKMGAGCGMMNIYTVAQSTEGVARAIEAIGDEAKQKGVMIGYDSRNNSALFARRSAEVLSAHGIKVYMFDELRPTPMLSAGVRHFGCIAGINITASHNPAVYNGYKLYWDDGAQPTKQMADHVSSFIYSTDIFEGVPSKDKADESLITMVGKEFDEIFMAKVIAEQVYPDVISKAADDLEIVYTPLCGAGYRIVPEVLRRIGVKHLSTVDSQMTPNGDFPGLAKPNPEYPAAFAEGIKVAAEVKSDLIIATDPDCDRVGVMARDKSGEFQCITGNQMGSLLLDYIFCALEEQGKLPEDAYAIKTIVTSEMATKICEVHGVDLHNVLTGFKFIAEVIGEHEDRGQGTFMLGYEESYGYMKGAHSRDKDGVVASMLICEMAAYYSLKGMTLIDAIDSLYEKYGYYMENSAEIYMEGLDGKEQINALMEKLRAAQPKEIAGSRVVNIRDYQAETSKNMITGEISGTGLPKSNVIYYKAENGCVVVARPSGTEPKIKFYILANGKDEPEAKANVLACTNALEDMLGIPHGSLKK